MYYLRKRQSVDNLNQYEISKSETGDMIVAFDTEDVERAIDDSINHIINSLGIKTQFGVSVS